MEPMTGIEPAYSAWEIFAARTCEREPLVEVLVSNPDTERYLRISVFGVRRRVESGSPTVRLRLRDRYGTAGNTTDARLSSTPPTRREVLRSSYP